MLTVDIGRAVCRSQACRSVEHTMSHEAEIEAISKLLADTRTELEQALAESERRALELYCEYLEARIARLRGRPNL